MLVYKRPHARPRGLVRPNYRLLGADVILWSSHQPRLLWTGQTPLPATAEVNPAMPSGAFGMARSWLNTNDGVDFGLAQPLNSSAGITVAAIGSPVASASRKTAFSQRTSGTNVPQINLIFNATAALGATSDYITLYARNSAGGVSAVTSGPTAGISGAHECYITGNSTVASSGYICRSGVALSLSTNQAMTGTYPVTTQRVRIGNIADYGTDGTLIHTDPLLLTLAWPRYLDPAFAGWLSKRLANDPWLAFEPRQIIVPVEAAAPTGPTVTAVTPTTIGSTSHRPRYTWTPA